MAINDPQYRYATQTWDADGVRTQYDIAFAGGYLYQEDVVAYSVSIDPETGLATDRTPHPVVFLSESTAPGTGWKTAQVEITPAVAAGRRVVIYRSTEKKAPLVMYVNGSVLTQANLDLANRQAIFDVAEIMDGLNEAGLAINEQVSEVIDLNKLIQQIYTTVLQLLAEGGITTTTPRTWFGVTDAETSDLPVVGADVTFAGMYDVYLDGKGLIPDEDYTIIVDPATGNPTSVLRLTTQPAAGKVWFAVLRGYAATPLNGGGGGTVGGENGEPVSNSQRIKIINVAGTTYTADIAAERGLVVAQNVAATTVTVKLRPNDATGDRIGNGSYFSVTQGNSGQVTLVGEVVGASSVTLLVPVGYAAKTRAINSTISATCINEDANIWLVGGDIALA